MEIKIDIMATVAATIISTVLASIAAWRIAIMNMRHQERVSLDALVIKMIDISVKYPYLESDAFCDNWDSVDKNSDEAMRYDNYCCLVFNLLERAWRHFNRDVSKVDRFIYVNEIIKLHQKWWKLDMNNNYAYSDDFVKFINSRI
jgi:hypothetical protein